MTAEKDITNRSLGYGMGNENKKPKKVSLGYEYPSDKVGTKSPSFNDYVKLRFVELQECEDMTPYKDKAVAFLRRHVNTSYQDFLKKTKPKYFVDERHRNPRSKGKKDILDVQMIACLSVLNDVEEGNLDVRGSLERYESKKKAYLGINPIDLLIYQSFGRFVVPDTKVENIISRITESRRKAMNLDTLIAQEIMDTLKRDSPHNKVLVGRKYKNYEVMGFMNNLSNLNGLIKEGLPVIPVFNESKVELTQKTSLKTNKKYPSVKKVVIVNAGQITRLCELIERDEGFSNIFVPASYLIV
jgi:hypothetical protein